MIKLTQYISSVSSIENWVNPDTIERVVKSGTGCTIVFVSGCSATYEEHAGYVVAEIERDPKTP
jgi:uncharacterized protein YlzI (FlbEa/FlbD family)